MMAVGLIATAMLSLVAAVVRAHRVRWVLAAVAVGGASLLGAAVAGGAAGGMAMLALAVGLVGSAVADRDGAPAACGAGAMLAGAAGLATMGGGEGISPVLGAESLALLWLPLCLVGVAAGWGLRGDAGSARWGAIVGALALVTTTLSLGRGGLSWVLPVMASDGHALSVLTWREGAGESALLERLVVSPDPVLAWMLLLVPLTLLLVSVRPASRAGWALPGLLLVGLVLVAGLGAPVELDTDAVQAFAVVGAGAANVVLHPSEWGGRVDLGPVLAVVGALGAALVLSVARPRSGAAIEALPLDEREVSVSPPGTVLWLAAGLLVAAATLRVVQNLRMGLGPGGDDPVAVALVCGGALALVGVQAGGAWSRAAAAVPVALLVLLAGWWSVHA